MATARYCPSCLSAVTRSSISQARINSAYAPSSLFSFQQTREVSQATALKYGKKGKDQPASQRKKKQSTTYHTADLRHAEQFSLLDAMRYLKAAEVGYPATQAKYELHIKLKTAKNGAVVRNRLRLPFPIKTDLRICVICPPDSEEAKNARAAGAVLVGEEEVFEQIKQGKIDFERCICHQESLSKLGKAGVARILGPRGLMPSAKTGTVVKNVGNAVKDMVGASEYRERAGVVRLGIGQLAFTPEEMQRNIRAVITNIKGDMANVSDQTPKSIHEVVLSSTHGPGFSLNGELRGPASPTPEELAVRDLPLTAEPA